MLTFSKWCEVLCDIRVVKIFEDSHFLAYLLNNQIIYCRLVPLFIIEVLKLLRCNIKMRERYLLHRILIFTFRNLVHWSKGAFTYQIQNLISSYLLNLLTSMLQKATHLNKVLCNLILTFELKLVDEMSQFLLVAFYWTSLEEEYTFETLYYNFQRLWMHQRSLEER